jgi:hypothetical protein
MAWEVHPDLVRYDATRALPDFQALSQAHPPLPCGLCLRALGRATLYRSVTLPVRVQGGSAQRDDAKRSL